MQGRVYMHAYSIYDIYFSRALYYIIYTHIYKKYIIYIIYIPIYTAPPPTFAKKRIIKIIIINKRIIKKSKNSNKKSNVRYFSQSLGIEFRVEQFLVLIQ